MAVTSPKILELMNARHEPFKPSLLLGRSQSLEKSDSGWNHRGYSTGIATDHEHADAQDESNEEY